MSNELVVQSIGTDLVSVEDLTRNVDVIKQAMKQVMVKDVHYGSIPGCGDKDALFQPGAHKLGLLFNLAPEYDITTNDLPGGHREYEVVCRLTHRGTGRFVGQGVGVCTTMESKYRFRSENTKRPVPSAYWEARDPELLGGPGFSAKKLDGKWVIVHRVAHDNPADYFNTVKKIAKKRAYNDAILTATAASDIFAPDDDTDPEFMGDDIPAAGESSGAVQQPRRRSAGNGNGNGGDNPITEKQAGLLRIKLERAEIAEAELCKHFVIETLEALPFGKMNEALEWVANPA